MDSTIAVNLRYLTSDNFTGAPLPGYEANRAYLRREAAAALGRVQQQLRAEGLGLLIWDAYRPVSGTEGMVAWAERTGNMKYFKQGYIARRSRHNMGVAVDLTLVTLDTGKPLDMGTPFDTFSGAAHTANATGPAAVEPSAPRGCHGGAGVQELRPGVVALLVRGAGPGAVRRPGEVNG